MVKYLHLPIYKLRVRSLHQEIVSFLQAGDHVLDVGCGSGALGRSIIESPSCPPQVKVTGLEKIRRGEEFTVVESYDGQQIPYPNDAYDVVILADVLHHARDPDNLIDECSRVARRLLIVKDHKVEGFLAKQRISIMDWASNMQYGVPCLYNYNTLEKWKHWFERHRLEIELEINSMKLYPPIINFFFGGRIQYLAVLRTDGVTS
ncbi:MAG: class I SAM-dependent methyltransferase [Desulfobacteraceae bacterium]